MTIEIQILNAKITPLSLKSNFCPLGFEFDLTFELCHLLLFTSPINWATAFFKQPWVAKKMVDFTVAGKKSPVHISICAGLSIVGTTATL